MTTRQKQIFLDEVFSGIDLARLSDMTGEECRLFLFEQAERLLAANDGGDLARYYAYNVVESREDGQVDVEPFFSIDTSVEGLWLVRLARLLAGVLDSDVNLTLEACGLPALKIDTREVFVTYDKEAFPNGIALFYDGLLKLFSNVTDNGCHLVAYIMQALCGCGLDWAVSHNPVVQDYLANAIHYKGIHGDGDWKKIGLDLMTALLNMQNHLSLGKESGLDDHGQFVVDALWGFVPHDYPAEFVASAKDIVASAAALLPAKKDKAAKQQFFDKVIQRCGEITKEHDVDFDTQIPNVSLSYMTYWLQYFYDEHAE
jgi:hypothetical protein